MVVFFSRVGLDPFLYLGFFALADRQLDIFGKENVAWCYGFNVSAVYRNGIMDSQKRKVFNKFLIN